MKLFSECLKGLHPWRMSVLFILVHNNCYVGSSVIDIVLNSKMKPMSLLFILKIILYREELSISPNYLMYK